VHNAGGLLKIGSTADTATELRVQGYKQSTVDAQLEINVKSLNSFDKLVVEGSVRSLVTHLQRYIADSLIRLKSLAAISSLLAP
jgi:menaquinone-dependent protoporphyrinogen IX oxidase